MGPKTAATRRPGLLFLRYGLPAVLIISGFVILFVAPDSSRYEGFAMCLGSGLSILLMNVLFRIGATGDGERHEEEAAREYLALHGHWPDEVPQAGGDRRGARPPRLAPESLAPDDRRTFDDLG